MESKLITEDKKLIFTTEQLEKYLKSKAKDSQTLFILKRYFSWAKNGALILFEKKQQEDG